MCNNNKCAQQRNTHHSVKVEIIEGQSGRRNDKFMITLTIMVMLTYCKNIRVFGRETFKFKCFKLIIRGRWNMYVGKMYVVLPDWP